MNIKNNKSIQVWIGFIHVKPKLNKISSLDGAIGAFFTGLVLAKNQKDYIRFFARRRFRDYRNRRC